MLQVFVLLVAVCSYSKAQDQIQELTVIQGALAAGDFDMASAMIDSSLEQHPKDGGLINLRGILHARRNEIGEARKDFEEAVRLRPQLTPAWQNLARACQQLNDVICAAQAWQRALRMKPADKEAHESLALLYEKQGKFAQSLRELDTGKIDNLMLRCLDLNGLRRGDDAKSAAAHLAARSEFSEADFTEMQGALDSSKAAGIIALLVRGLDARGAAGVASLQSLVVAYEQLGRATDARKTLERIAKLDPNNVAHLLELARLAENTKDFEGALGYLAHARDLEPDSARIHFLFGLIAGELNLPIEAKNSLERALAIDPYNPDYHYAIGLVILKTRDAATAASHFEKFVKARPADARGHCALGVAYFTAGDYDKAKEQMALVEHDSKLAAAAQYYFGRMARLEGEFDEASQRLHKSIEIMPEFSETHTELARIAMSQGHLNEAKAELEHALRLAPDSFQANQQLLVLYKRTHDVRAEKQAEVLKKLDEERSRRAELMLRTLEVRP